MLGSIIKIYRTGKELGLTRKEIKKILLFDNSKRPKVYNILLLIALLALFIFSILSMTTVLGYVFENTYARGTLYATINTKDFQNKERLVNKLLQHNK